MSVARFLAQLEEPLVTRADGIEATVSVGSMSLTRVLRLVAFTGMGRAERKRFAIRMVSRSVPGIACLAWLSELRVMGRGESRVLLLLEKPDYKALSGLMNRTVGIEVKEERGDGE